LVIGGTPGNLALLTIAASDSSGNPLLAADGDGIAFRNPPATVNSSSTSPMAVDTSQFIAAGNPSIARGLPSNSASAVGADGASDASGVPEPSSLVYAAIALISGVVGARRREASQAIWLL
jgi:hypothetical protein